MGWGLLLRCESIAVLWAASCLRRLCLGFDFEEFFIKVSDADVAFESHCVGTGEEQMNMSIVNFGAIIFMTQQSGHAEQLRQMASDTAASLILL